MPMEHVHEQYRIPLPAEPGQPMSEFNHHLAGAVVLLVGVSAILLYIWPQRLRFLRYIWPLSLMLLGVYLVIYSDPPSWPTGYHSLSESLRDPETRQHKVYALLLLLMGGIELARAARIAVGDKWKYAFPCLAAVGALYLIVHKHGVESGAQMHMDHAGEGSHLMVLYQHVLYIVLGVGVAVTKVLYDTRRLRSPWAPYIWPSLTVLLGLALVLYRE